MNNWLVYAQNEFSTVEGNLKDVLSIFTDIIAPGVFALALIAVFWLGFQAINQGSGESTKKLGYAIVAFFVIAAIWGLVAFLQSAIGIDDTERGNVPGLEI